MCFVKKILDSEDHNMAASYIQEEHEIFRQSLRKFLEKEAYPNYDKWEEDRIIPRDF